MNLNEKVQQLTTEGYEFKFSKYLSDGFDYFKTQAGLFIGFFVISFIIIIAASFIPLVGSIASSVLSLTFLVGYYIVCSKIKQGNHVAFDDFFKGFSSIGQITIIQLILLGFTLIIFLPLLIFGFSIFFSGIFSAIKANSFQEPQSVEELLALFNVDGLIPLFIITVILIMFMQTIYTFSAANSHFFKANSWQSMEASRKVIQQKFFHFFGLMLVIMLINVLGTLCLLIGLLVTIPLSYTIMYSAFDDIMQPDYENLINENTSFEKRSN